MFDVKVDKSDPTDLYEQVAAEIRRAIAEGEAKPGERLPPAKDLAAILEVNTNTVLRSLRLLRDEGLLEFRRGRGISVAGTPERGAVIQQASQLVYKFPTCAEITLQLAYLVLGGGDFFRRLFIEHRRNDIELGLDRFVSCSGAASEPGATAACLFCNSSLNNVRESFRRPDDPHNCDLFILKLIRRDRCKVGEQISVQLLCLLLVVIPPVRRNDNVRRSAGELYFLLVQGRAFFVKGGGHIRNACDIIHKRRLSRIHTD